MRRSTSNFLTPLRRLMTGELRITAASRLPIQRNETERTCTKLGTPVHSIRSGMTNVQTTETKTKPLNRHCNATVDLPEPLAPIKIAPRELLPTQAPSFCFFFFFCVV